jgi:hypothetical protein
MMCLQWQLRRCKGWLLCVKKYQERKRFWNVEQEVKRCNKPKIGTKCKLLERTGDGKYLPRRLQNNR